MHHVWRKNTVNSGGSLDKFYTKTETVTKCLNELNNMPYNYDCVIEPSAGNGAFYHQIKHSNKIGIDIDPGHEDIIKADWLTYRISADHKCVLIVGNPPFGKYHSMSSQFICRSFLFNNVQTIAFILPNVYRKHTRQKILPINWRILSIMELGKNCFYVDNKPYHIPSSFFIFDKSTGTDLREDTSKYKDSDDFTFSDREDFDIFVFGSSPTKITKNPKPNNRGYFLKSNIPIDDLINKIKSIDWVGNSCASGGVYWLTKYEFLKQYMDHHESNKSVGNTGLYFG